MNASKDFLHSQAEADGLVWQEQGAGVLNWSVFSIYRATLWTSGQLTLQDNLPANAAFALQFEYLRNVSADYIVQASQRELSRLSAHPAEQIATWMTQLHGCIPDAGRGDLLWILFRIHQDVRFYNNEQLLGEIVDGDFVQAFADIWFHPDCHSPRLRAQLLGAI